MADVYGMNRGAPMPTAGETAQDQLRAAALGLDLEHYQIYKRAPKDWTNRWANNYNAETGKFNFPGMTPGALQSNSGSPISGPGGYTLAAGSTAGNPVDLSSLSLVKTNSEKWNEANGGNFLPPYLTAAITPSGSTGPAATPTPTDTGTPPPVNPPEQIASPTAPAPGKATRGPNNILEVPFYLRPRKAARGPSQSIAYG